MIISDMAATGVHMHRLRKVKVVLGGGRNLKSYISYLQKATYVVVKLVRLVKLVASVMSWLT